MKKLLSIILITVIFTMSITAFAQEPSCSEWAKDYVNWAEETGVGNYSDYTLSATRLDYCKMLYSTVEAMKSIFNEDFPLKANDASAENIFDDCNDTAVNYMYTIGVVNGTGDSTFSPDAPINREQIAVMTYRLAKLLNINGISGELTGISFNDMSDMSAWAVEGISQLKATGIMDGVGDNMFSPKSVFTLEQSAALANKLFTKYSADYSNEKIYKVNIESSIYTNEVISKVRTKFGSNIKIAKFDDDTQYSKTKSIISSNEAFVIIVSSSEQFTEILDKYGVSYSELSSGILCIEKNVTDAFYGADETEEVTDETEGFDVDSNDTVIDDNINSTPEEEE